MQPMMDSKDATTAEALMEHVERIASYIRSSGDAEEAKAFDYIESCLQKWHVNYERTTHPAFISLPGPARLTVGVGVGESLGEGMQEYPCITHSMSAATTEAGCSGQVVYVHAGTREDYQHVEFTPQSVALLDGLATPEKTMIAKEHRAAAVIYINGEELHEMIVSPVWGSPSSEKTALLPNIPVVSVLGADGDRIREQLLQHPTTQATLFTEVVTQWRPIPMLIAEIEGAVYPEEVVMLSGHVDSWHYGAMDNASANAVQLEALRVFKARQPQLLRTLRVAFWSGHSHGRYAGSTWYVDNHFEEIVDRVVLHMYVDSVGGQGATILSEAWAMSETKPVAVQALAAETGEVFNGARFGRGGDQSFYGAGVSCLYMCLSEQPPATQPGAVNVSHLLGGNGKTGGLGSWWHAVDDTADKLDPAFLLRDARIYFASLAAYLETARLAFDFRPTVAELQMHLAMWQAKAGERFSLQAARLACDSLQQAVEQFYARESDASGTLDAARFNKVVIGLSRHLVPMNYSTGNRFEHDLALGYPPMPALQPIEELSSLAVGSDAEQHLLVLLQRRCNYITHTLLQATAHVRQALAGL